jgi:uncharacterized protein with HEPN domain
VRDDKEILAKILECINRIREYTKSGKDAFLKDQKTQDAVVRNFQIIGDAVKDLSSNLRDKHQDVDWAEWAKSRDKITHQYFDVDYEKVWGAVQNDIGPLRDKVEDIHKRLVYKVSSDQAQPSKLVEKLKENGEQDKGAT